MSAYYCNKHKQRVIQADANRVTATAACWPAVETGTHTVAYSIRTLLQKVVSGAIGNGMYTNVSHNIGQKLHYQPTQKCPVTWPPPRVMCAPGEKPKTQHTAHSIMFHAASVEQVRRVTVASSSLPNVVMRACITICVCSSAQASHHHRACVGRIIIMMLESYYIFDTQLSINVSARRAD